MSPSGLAPWPSRRFSARIPTPTIPNLNSESCPSRRGIRVLKDRLGDYARPEGRDEPFRARALAEPPLLADGFESARSTARVGKDAARAPLVTASNTPASIVSPNASAHLRPPLMDLLGSPAAHR